MTHINIIILYYMRFAKLYNIVTIVLNICDQYLLQYL